MANRFALILPMLLAAALPTKLIAETITIGGIPFPLRYETAEAPVVIKGTGILKYAFFLKVYVAALYGPEAAAANELLDTSYPKRLEIVYLVSARASDLARAANSVLEAQLSEDELNNIKTRVDRLHATYRNVQKGDRYALAYEPAYGTVLQLNGEPLAHIEGQDFARAYFGIWLDDPPISPALKQALLTEDR